MSGPDVEQIRAERDAAVKALADAMWQIEERNVWRDAVADIVEPLGFDREAACGPADLLPGLRCTVETSTTWELDEPLPEGWRALRTEWSDRTQDMAMLATNSPPNATLHRDNVRWLPMHRVTRRRLVGEWWTAP